MYRNERGITLVELLGSIALLSVILLLIGSVHFFGQRQFREQTSDINNQEKVRYVMSRVTSDVRSTTYDQSNYSEGTLQLGANTYQFSDTTLLRNGVVISEDLNDFIVDVDADKIELTVVSQPNRRGNRVEVNTTIYFRR